VVLHDIAGRLKCVVLLMQPLPAETIDTGLAYVEWELVEMDHSIPRPTFWTRLFMLRPERETSSISYRTKPRVRGIPSITCNEYDAAQEEYTALCYWLEDNMSEAVPDRYYLLHGILEAHMEEYGGEDALDRTGKSI